MSINFVKGIEWWKIVGRWFRAKDGAASKERKGRPFSSCAVE